MIIASFLVMGYHEKKGKWPLLRKSTSQSNSSDGNATVEAGNSISAHDSRTTGIEVISTSKVA